MAKNEKRPARLANGTRVHVRSDHFAEECDAVVTKAEYDAGWLYRVKLTGGTAPAIAKNQEGEYWLWDFEVTPLGRRKR